VKTWLPFHLLILFSALVLVGSGCVGAPATAPQGETLMSIQISSAAFREGSAIPKKYTCDGEDVSPSLAWSGIPTAAKSLALIVDDPDAPVGVWVHWVIYNLLPTLTGLPEGVSKTPSVQGLGLQGSNDFRKTGYNGPCPPRGKPHRYFFKLYALDSALDLKAGVTKADVEKAMKGHILASGQTIGTYGR
jgi:Raf kinase inhibitor-like YbhB/YbcL family protein